MLEIRRLSITIRLARRADGPGGDAVRGPVSTAAVDLQAYLNRLASAEPTPGGGSAATLVGALGAGLIAMVARITLANARYAEVHAEAILLIEAADALRARFAAARTRDETAYSAVPTAQALPRSTPAERAARAELLQSALAGAAAAPLAAAELALEALALCERAAALRNTHLMSDVECALLFAEAALAASAANVRVNHRFLKDELLVAAQAEQLAAIDLAARDHARATRALIDAPT